MPRVYRVMVELGDMEYMRRPDMLTLKVSLWTDDLKQYHQVEQIPVDHMSAYFDQIVMYAASKIKDQIAKESLR